MTVEYKVSPASKVVAQFWITAATYLSHVGPIKRPDLAAQEIAELAQELWLAARRQDTWTYREDSDG